MASKLINITVLKVYFLNMLIFRKTFLILILLQFFSWSTSFYFRASCNSDIVCGEEKAATDVIEQHPCCDPINSQKKQIDQCCELGLDHSSCINIHHYSPIEKNIKPRKDLIFNVVSGIVYNSSNIVKYRADVYGLYSGGSSEYPHVPMYLSHSSFLL